MTINSTSTAREAEIAERVAAYATPEAIRADMTAAAERRARWATEGEAPIKPRTIVTSDPAPAPTVRPASEAAVRFLVSLTLERIVGATEAAVRGWADEHGAAAVSRQIDALKAMPKLVRPVTEPTTSPAVPAGRYAVENEAGELRFYKVDRPTEGRWAGYVFVKVQASDEEYNIRGRVAADAILARIEAAGVEAAAIRYGVELQHCYACGRALTDALSRELGIGPDCRSK